VDGLRAVAILPVLLFHAGVSTFSGGYVGVDVFFVISGYLITGIIAREIDQGRFSILAFYERRARRILPALLAVIAFVLLGASLLYLPGDFESVPKSALAATFFVSNVTFFLETGYFQGGAETKPLLHTWSLAIEEQFYIGFPILLMLLARYLPSWRTAVVAVIALFSFALAVATQTDGSGFAFYLLPPRAWELFAGSLVALGVIPTVRSRAVREGIAWGGLALIAYAVLTFDKSTVFPGVNALFPVIGAATLIHCAPGTSVGRLLGWKPMVGIGLISYSLYLWHWPLIVFASYATDAKLTGWASLAVILASLVIATLSWRFVEEPFRRRERFSRRSIFAMSGVSMGAVCAVAAVMVGAGGWPGRFSPEVVRMAQAQHDVSPYRDRCHDSDADAGRPPCVLGADVPPSALLWGDSHGVELAFALSRMKAVADRSLLQRTQSSCPPVLGYDPPEDPRCARVNRQVFEEIRAQPRLQTIYLAAFWGSGRYDSPEFGAQLEQTIRHLLEQGRRVVLIGPIPSHWSHVPRRLARFAQSGRLEQAARTPRSTAGLNEMRLRKIAARWKARGVAYVDAAAALCEGQFCSTVNQGAPLYFDSHHLSVTGANVVIAAVARELKNFSRAEVRVPLTADATEIPKSAQP
jgi:peptidoglycan/LPS O-acetylase OafA/YrhL